MVDVEFKELKADLKNVTLQVKDSKGVVRKVESQDLDKGADNAQFDFVEVVKEDDLKGVWTVNGIEYSFDELELVAKIVAEAGEATVDEVKLYNLLLEAGIKNVDPDLIDKYATEIDTEGPVWFKDVQKNIDDVNKEEKEEADEDAIVKAVVDAENQIQLLVVLEENFEKVNADWITDYATKGTIGTKTGLLQLVKAENYPGESKAVTVENIQDHITAQNTVAINAANTAAAKASDQAKVTSMIEKWEIDDDPDTPKVTPKADAIKASKAKEAAFKVAEAKTANSLYNALVAYANATEDTVLKLSELNANLKAEYKAELDAGTVQADLVTQIKTDHADTTNGVKAVIVTAADATALAAAEGVVAGLDGDSKTTDIKKALQKLADVTSHKTGSAKFDMSIVEDDLLEDYVVEFMDTTQTTTLAGFVTDIETVNGGVAATEALETINDVDAKASDVRAALLELALNTTLDAGTTDKDFINLSPQARLEVAELVTEARKTKGSDYDTADEVLKAADGTGVLRTEIDAHGVKVGKFNAIGDLASAETTDIQAALASYEYEAYDDLSTVDKIAVAEEIGKLVHVDKEGVKTAYDFSGTDAVKTFKEANDYIDAAIAAL